MKGIVPALNKVQLACQDRKAPLSDIGSARKELFAAIREALEGAALAATKDTAAISLNQRTNLLDEYLAKFDKLNQ